MNWKILKMYLHSLKKFNFNLLFAIISFLFFFIFFSLEKSLDVPIFHIDGAYQTASSLYRISAGYHPGSDFFPYLGIAINYLLFPIYYFSGENLAASQFSAQLVTQVAGSFSIGLIFSLMFKESKKSTAILVGCIGQASLLLMSQSFSSILPDPFWFSITTGNSLRPLRAIVPYVVVVLLLAALHLAYSKKFILLASIIFSVALLWSNDFAIPSAIMYALILVYLFRNLKVLNGRDLVLSLGFGFFLWCLLISIITAGRPFDFLAYNLLDVAKDQWWYFAPYSSHFRVFSIKDLFNLATFDLIFSLFVMGCISIFALKNNDLRRLLLAWIGFVLFAGGLTASIGGHIDSYFNAFIFWAGVTTLFFLIGLVGSAYSKRCDSMSLPSKSILHILLEILILLLGLGLVMCQLNSYLLAKKTRAQDNAKIYIKELGGYLSKDFSDYVDFARNNKSSVVLEEYWGIFSAINKSFSSWPVDSVIHALGAMRGRAKDSIRDADLVVTTRYKLSTDWQPWNLSQNYWFYDELFKNWEIVTQSPTTIIWKRAERVNNSHIVPSTIGAHGELRINVPKSGFYKIELRYKLHCSSRCLLMLQNNISFAADADGFVSVDPKGDNVVYPVYAMAAGENIFKQKVVNGNLNDFLVLNCTVSTIPSFSNEVLHKKNDVIDDFFIFYNSDAHLVSENCVPSGFYITDYNWVEGFGRHHAGFFVPNLYKFSRDYSELGSTSRVVFESGDSRRITSVVENGKYLNITVEGPILRLEEVGLQHKFKVQK